jgi:uncharacterized protein
MRARPILLLVLICGLSGCISERPRRVYVLSDALASPAVGTATTVGPVLLLQRVLVPDYLDTTEIDLRVGAHQLRASTTARWGERLSLGITHALRADLAARLPMQTVTLDSMTGRAARQVLVSVAAFDVWPDGRCVLAASWTILDAQSGAVLTAGKSTLVTGAASGGKLGDAGLVAAMANTVAELAGRIADAVNGLRRVHAAG